MAEEATHMEDDA
jgi:hypothetical protein